MIASVPIGELRELKINFRNSRIIKEKKVKSFQKQKTKKKKMTTNKNASWLNNRNATKNPKVFNVTMYRDEFGRFHAIGGQSLVLNKKSNKWEKVNTRALTRTINNTGIKSL